MTNTIAGKIKNAQAELNAKKDALEAKLTPIFEEFINEVGSVNINVNCYPHTGENGKTVIKAQVSATVK